MKLQEYYNLTPEEKKIQDEKARLSLIESAKELDEKGIWSIPSDLKKRLVLTEGKKTLMGLINPSRKSLLSFLN
jgi:hypothetical protein